MCDLCNFVSAPGNEHSEISECAQISVKEPQMAVETSHLLKVPKPHQEARNVARAQSSKNSRFFLKSSELA